MGVSVQLDAYTRVSQTRGRSGVSLLSPDQQRDAIERYASAYSHDIVWHEPELDQSGGKMSRPIFDHVMARVAAKQTEGVIVAKADRFARSLVGALGAIERIEKVGGVFISTADNFDTSTPSGRLMMHLMFSFAEFELDRIRQSWSDAVADAVVERGIQPTIAPFGYRKGPDRRFVVDADEGPMVREIFRRRIAGQTWEAIARWLNAEGIKPRQSAQWNGNTVKQLTVREVYLGVAAKGQHRNEHAHEPLVSAADFAIVREVFAKSGDGPSETRHALNGLIRCAGCSRLMSGRGYKQKGRPRVAQYQCAVNHTAGGCPAPANVNESRVMPYVESEFFEYVGRIAVEQASDTPELSAALATEADAKCELEAFVTAASALDADLFALGLEGRQKAAQRATEAVIQAKQSTSGVELPDEATLREVWTDLNAAERQRLLASAIDVIYIRRTGSGPKRIEDRAIIVWRGENAFPLSGPGVSVPLREFAW
jgi:site-specific DNA recombinase